jgi:hypothetical protein
MYMYVLQELRAMKAQYKTCWKMPVERQKFTKIAKS